MKALISLGAMLFFIYYCLYALCKIKPDYIRFSFGIIGIVLSAFLTNILIVLA